MPLTPEDVRNKRFTPVRLREGYDMGEVDQFLDEVEAELERLTVENEELRAKVAAASTGEPTGLIPALSSPTPARRRPLLPSRSLSEYTPPTRSPSPSRPRAGAAPRPPSLLRPRAPSMGDASSAAARLLEIASSNADQLMDAAKEEADRIVGEARAKAERLTNEARGKADRLETDARIRAQKLDEETNERRTAGRCDDRARSLRDPARGRAPAGVRARVPRPAQELLPEPARPARGQREHDQLDACPGTGRRGSAPSPLAARRRRELLSNTHLSTPNGPPPRRRAVVAGWGVAGVQDLAGAVRWRPGRTWAAPPRSGLARRRRAQVVVGERRGARAPRRCWSPRTSSAMRSACARSASAMGPSAVHAGIRR